MPDDLSCSIHPYFKINAGELDAFRALCERFVERTKSEPGCLYYGFSFDGDVAHCREGYQNAQALLAHLANVDDLIAASQKIATITRVEVHGPESEMNQLREPLAELNPHFYVLEYGFRK
jgi:quinol monooxygenase YgiN